MSEVLEKHVLEAARIAELVPEPLRPKAFELVLQGLLTRQVSGRGSIAVGDVGGLVAEQELTKKKLSLVEFVRRKPETAPQYVAAIGYYTEKIEAKPGFSTADIRAGFKSLRLPYKNPSHALAQAQAQGLVMGEGGLKILTQKGEAWVEERLKEPRE